MRLPIMAPPLARRAIEALRIYIRTRDFLFCLPGQLCAHTAGAPREMRLIGFSDWLQWLVWAGNQDAGQAMVPGLTGKGLRIGRV